jgi:hypothetical protein
MGVDPNRVSHLRDFDRSATCSVNGREAAGGKYPGPQPISGIRPLPGALDKRMSLSGDGRRRRRGEIGEEA